MSDLEVLSQTAQALVAPAKGILAADESSGTIKRRFDSIGVEKGLREGVVVAVELLVGPRLADPGGRREPFQAVQPAVGSPVEAVDRLMTVPDAPAGA